jgi:antitoxin Phd
LGLLPNGRAGKFWLDWTDLRQQVPAMKTWPLQDAKNQFSQVVDRAQKDGPQTITRHGQPVAVILAAEDFRKMARPRESVVEFFAPLKGSGITLNRPTDLPRKRRL